MLFLSVAPVRQQLVFLRNMTEALIKVIRLASRVIFNLTQMYKCTEYFKCDYFWKHHHVLPIQQIPISPSGVCKVYWHNLIRIVLLRFLLFFNSLIIKNSSIFSMFLLSLIIYMQDCMLPYVVVSRS